MIKVKPKVAILSILMMTLLTACGSKNLNKGNSDISSLNKTPSDSLGTVSIQYNLKHISKLASNQLAVWIEDSKGNYIKTIYVTKFAALGGYKKRPQAIPEWVKKSNWENATRSEVDSVSGATKDPGKVNFTWNCTDKNNRAVKPGKYFYLIEGNIYWENRVIWKGEIEVGNKEDKSEANAKYIPKNASSVGKLIERVTAVFKPR